jgi:hypothetical protein
MVGSGKVAFDGKALFEGFVAVELRSVVQGEGLEAGTVVCDGLECGLGDRLGGPRAHLLDDEIA